MRGRWWCGVFTPVLCALGCREAQELSLVSVPGNYTISNTRPNKDAEMFCRMYSPVLQSGLLLQHLLRQRGLSFHKNKKKTHHICRKLKDEIFQYPPNGRLIKHSVCITLKLTDTFV